MNYLNNTKIKSSLSFHTLIQLVQLADGLGYNVIILFNTLQVHIRLLLPNVGFCFKIFLLLVLK